MHRLRSMHGSATPAPPAPGFPLRVGAIDVGSNAIRFLAAEFLDAHRWAELDRERAPVRLGTAAFRSGVLDADAMHAAAEAIAGFRTRMDALGVRRWRAVATGAARTGRNREELVRRVREASRVELEVIGGGEEARLVHRAVREVLPLGEGRWVLVDLGGGSVEVSLVDAGAILWSESHPVGAVRLLQEGVDADAPALLDRVLARHAPGLRVPSLRDGEAVGMIAAGGSADALAELAGAPPAPGRPGTLRVAELRRLAQLLSRLTPAERVEEYGLRADRADVILPAALMYERLALLAGAEEVRVPGVGVREGVLYDVLDRESNHGG